jgi:biopolymer transport protein ExbD
MSRFSSPEPENNVACNVVPMIDIMFLLLLFFMLGADMSIKEIGNLVLPNANMVEEGDKTKKTDEAISNVNICHLGEKQVTCPAYKTGAVCREAGHWEILIQGKPWTTETVKTRLKELADLNREPLAANQKPGTALSSRLIKIRSDAQAPYLLAQKVMEACAVVGLYKIELAAAQPPAEKT